MLHMYVLVGYGVGQARSKTRLDDGVEEGRIRDPKALKISPRFKKKESLEML